MSVLGYLRRGDAGAGVGGAGTGGDQHHPDLAGGAGIAVSHVGRALLVADQNVLDLLPPINLVVDVQYRATRIPENEFHPLVFEELHYDLGA